MHFQNNYTRSLAEMTELITNRNKYVDTETFINGFVNSWIDLSSNDKIFKNLMLYLLLEILIISLIIHENIEVPINKKIIMTS